MSENIISPQYNPKEIEERISTQWLIDNVSHAEIDSAKAPYTIVIPPPNITGILHMGHALNDTLQDVLIRFKRMQGYQALWMPGTDHAGIATQNVVERDLAKQKIKKEDIGREEFLKRLWQWTDTYGSTIIEQLKRLGASCDWERQRFTMDDKYSETVADVFIRLYQKGLIYRGNYIINWCPRCKTALSDEEAAHREIDGWLYYLRYPVKDNPEQYVVVATTRPETMLGDTAVAINPRDERYQWLKGKTVILPILNRELKVIEDEAIDLQFGTGVVKVTPAHDPVDFNLGKKHNLEFINIMYDNAVLNENAGEFANMDRFEARQALLEVLGEKNLIEKKDPYKLSAGHCYRCHTIVEPRISLQWFVKMKPLAEKAIKVVEEDTIQFYPQRWKKVYLNWMYNIADWCISRQIWWGHRIPVYYCPQCQKENEASGIIVSRIKPDQCPQCHSAHLIEEQDVLDTWFSSWLWPFATFYWPQETKELKYFYPTNTLVTASEILFFWVARMIMAGLEFKNEIPFKDVIIHGTVRDAQGVKMSKSLGNIIDPVEVIGKFGADSLRFSLMMLAASGSDVFLSDEKFLVGRNFCNKIWNANRFLLLKINENKFFVDNLAYEKTDGIDAWVLSEFNRIIEETTKYLDAYRINDAVKVTYEFFWHTFCDWYIEIVKDTMTLDKAKIALTVLLGTLKLLHPIMPFITEEIYAVIQSNTNLCLGKTIVTAQWPKAVTFTADEKNVQEVRVLIQTISEIRNIKADLGVPQKKVPIELRLNDQSKLLWEINKNWICRLTFSDEIRFSPQLSRTVYKNDLWEINLAVEQVDINNFLLSLDKKIGKLDAVLQKVSQRLSNDNFLKNAAVETIAEEKIKYNQISTQVKRLHELKNAFA